MVFFLSFGANTVSRREGRGAASHTSVISAARRVADTGRKIRVSRLSGIVLPSTRVRFWKPRFCRFSRRSAATQGRPSVSSPHCKLITSLKWLPTPPPTNRPCSQRLAPPNKGIGRWGMSLLIYCCLSLVSGFHPDAS